ncbi:hypothetical protein BAUCODRAFT_175264 [Baudoinia panamericana UAMH 10762]|uniref:Photolyase/cryptochrome alpha/beta domain-containing protein n=1 Tax=Baudoinia panamericana (strain UAMH 10762) TaxID=717646 RepID=M2NN02_BAUPA|nr:uncharacterized protein BAUCODRAFT_175264 [Baudoinia panamericana UAMH 10762]EMD00586.1 hypothetical protein BAUCODRAFT_175264 [Baudoinia panamericana UAMH 10762]
MSKPRVLYWFRTDLRLHDSPALKAALDLQPEVLYPIWCWDPHYVYHARVGNNRWQFLIDCMNDVSRSITNLNPNSKLFVLREPAVTLLSKLFTAWRITHIVFEKDTDAYARERDKQVVESARKAGVEVIVKSGRTLWDSDDIVKAHNGKPTMSISQLQSAGSKVGDIALPIEPPKSIPNPGDTNLDIKQERPSSEPDINEQYRDADEGSYSFGIAGPNGDYSVPTLKELGLKAATTPHRGGESVVLGKLHIILADEDYTGTFEKPKTSPAAFEPQATCLTSPYLHFGALSCRYFYHRIEEIVERRRKAKRPVSEPPTSLTGQLLFRDMYFAAQAALGYSFGQTYNNDHCRFIPWHLPSRIDVSTKLITGDYEVDDEVKQREFIRWREGKTGFPWIDAIMRQLKYEGWIHHLARHAVACFLTRGGCYISWERGAEVFEEWLIDHEAACNIGNWQWLSCTAFYSQFYRCYSPIAFGRKWDDNGDFIRKYVPELKDMPKKYIYEPHKAPVQDQKKAGVLIKGDGEEEERDGTRVYPKPMFDFPTQREICIQGMKAAYHVGLRGKSPQVLDGTWKRLFDDHAEGPTEGGLGGPGGMMSFDNVDGIEIRHRAPATPKRGVKREASDASPSKSAHTRVRGQSTLDGAFRKKKP